jgi:hypothetical protein
MKFFDRSTIPTSRVLNELFLKPDISIPRKDFLYHLSSDSPLQEKIEKSKNREAQNPFIKC